MTAEKKTRPNRRRSFRIYEQVDMCYQQLDTHLKSAPDPDTPKPRTVSSQTAVLPPSTIEDEFPESVCRQNSTLNINISTSGISFTCKDEFKPGDYLMIRVLMLSSMTLIMTCCKVVYCKPSNPFESNQYPYAVGAQFVNLTEKDRDILNRHIQGKRLRKTVVWSLMAILGLVILYVPELVFELAWETGLLIWEYVVSVVELINDLISYSLDEMVAFIFHTEQKNTQIISFYFQFFLYLVLGLYLLIRIIPSMVRKLYNRFREFYLRKKSSLDYYWSGQSVLFKTAAIICFTLLMGSFVLVLI